MIVANTHLDTAAFVSALQWFLEINSTRVLTTRSHSKHQVPFQVVLLFRKNVYVVMCCAENAPCYHYGDECCFLSLDAAQGLAVLRMDSFWNR